MHILLLSHQLDFSGAPIALLRLAEALIDQGHTLSLGSMQDGPLASEFIKLGTKQFNPSIAKQYDLYFANTFFSVPLALNLAPKVEKIIAWIHESRNFFALFGIDENLYGLNQLKHAVFPSSFMLYEYKDLIPLAQLSQLRNLVSMEGICETKAYRDYIAVTGHWQKRKNQSRLIELSEQSNLNLRFNFIGAEKPPHIPSSNHNFFGQVPQMEAKKIIANSMGLISAAQSETQNLTALEAMLVGKPVLLSNISAHQELRCLIPNIPLFDTTDSVSFKNGFEQFKSLAQDQKKLNENMQLSKQFFGRSAFNENVRKLLSKFQ